MNARGRTTRRRGLRDLFVVLYLIVQTTVPIGGLVLAHRADAPVRFSWHMFSRVLVSDDE